MLQVSLTVVLKLRGPILTQSSSVAGYGVDAPFARSPDGRCYLPGSLVKGRLREAWNELHEAAPCLFGPRFTEWLGEESGSRRVGTKPYEPVRGRLHFSDFIDTSGSTARRTQFRIRIDEERGSVAKGAYLVIEAPYAAGQEASFRGEIRYVAKSGAESDQIRKSVEAGLRWIPSLGAERTIGFGRLLEVSLEEKRQDVKATLPAKGIALMDIALTPEGPFCIARRRVADNLFESEKFLPGNAIKACIASKLNELQGKASGSQVNETTDPQRKELCRNFHRIRILHAFPSTAAAATRPVWPPLSLVKVKGSNLPLYYDVALCRGPGLIDGQAPAFDVDWKESGDVWSSFGWPRLRRDLRVRTAIERDLRKAKEEALFAYEMIVPEECRWHGRIDLSQVPQAERAEVEGQLRAVLEGGVTGLGKTKVRAGIQILEEAIPAAFSSSTEPLQDDLWVISLQTPALLCNPDSLLKDDEVAGSGSEQDLRAAYQSAWHDLSGGSLELLDYYQRLSLAGGDYLHNRFQRGKPYQPYLLTEPGSVFVLRAATTDASKAGRCVSRWYSHGLDFPSWAKAAYARNGNPGDHWSNCPYLPEHGFGEINVNLPVHTTKRPGGFHAV